MFALLLLRLINYILHDYLQEESGILVHGKGDNIFEILMFEMPELDLSLVKQISLMKIWHMFFLIFFFFFYMFVNYLTYFFLCDFLFLAGKCLYCTRKGAKDFLRSIRF